MRISWGHDGASPTLGKVRRSFKDARGSPPPARRAVSQPLDYTREARRRFKKVSAALDALADLTTLRERELEHALKRAAVAADAKAEFLANMSHEFHTPLNSIIGFATLIRDGSVADPAKVQEYAAAIERSGQRLLELLNDVLELSRLAEGDVTLSDEPVDVAALVRCCIASARDGAAVSGVAISGDAADNLPWVVGDRLRLKQVLRHILSNAVKFTPAGGSVHLMAAKAERGVILAVRDSGMGMAPHEIGRACEPFEHGERATTRKHGGAGLGLALAKRLIELHGGALTIETAKGAGTTVTVHIPESRIVPADSHPVARHAADMPGFAGRRDALAPPFGAAACRAEAFCHG